MFALKFAIDIGAIPTKRTHNFDSAYSLETAIELTPLSLREMPQPLRNYVRVSLLFGARVA